MKLVSVKSLVSSESGGKARRRVLVGRFQIFLFWFGLVGLVVLTLVVVRSVDPFVNRVVTYVCLYVTQITSSLSRLVSTEEVHEFLSREY